MNFIYKYFYDWVYYVVYDVVEKMMKSSIQETIQNTTEDIAQDATNYVNDAIRNMIYDKIDFEVRRISPLLEDSLRTWFIERIRDGKFPSDAKEYWVCIFCEHVDKKECKYCSQCGSKW